MPAPTYPSQSSYADDSLVQDTSSLRDTLDVSIRHSSVAFTTVAPWHFIYAFGLPFIVNACDADFEEMRVMMRGWVQVKQVKYRGKASRTNMFTPIQYRTEGEKTHRFLYTPVDLRRPRREGSSGAYGCLGRAQEEWVYWEGATIHE
ncbi:hypothetical protein VNI00_009234, partial [Paramarasmius palmivorus]